jgi:hypothetical protein
VSLTHVDDMGSFGSISGVSEHGTPADNKSTVKKRKAADLSCSDSEVEVICEKSKDSSQEEHVRKKPRESVEFLRYASTPHRSSKAPSFQASDVSDEAINLRSIPEEDTADDLVSLHYSPSQDVDMPINSGSISAHSKKPVEAVQKLNLISQEESPDTEKSGTLEFSQIIHFIKEKQFNVFNRGKINAYFTCYIFNYKKNHVL